MNFGQIPEVTGWGGAWHGGGREDWGESSGMGGGARIGARVHGYLAHKKLPTPLGTPYGPRHRATVGSQAAAVSYERGTPVITAPLDDALEPGPFLQGYKGTSLTRKGLPLGSYRRPLTRSLSRPWGGRVLFRGGVPGAWLEPF